MLTINFLGESLSVLVGEMEKIFFNNFSLEGLYC